MFAASSGNKEIVQLLLDKGAKIDAKNEDGSTALMKSVISCSPEMVQFLLKNKANCNAKNSKDETILDTLNKIISKDDSPEFAEIKKMLIAEGAQTSAQLNAVATK